ncbi:MBG domain-containing protein [Mucilaginibacter sp. PAMB04274]|uniref:MBG domain-containing protein n=1 Tax=Mucilaginibacter sp. PAMB04274 TaxID=3138568 RepID=UPI0031F691B2
MRKFLPVLLALFIFCFVDLSFANTKRIGKKLELIRTTKFKASSGAAKIKLLAPGLPNALQTFSGYTTDSKYPAFAYSPDGFFGVTNSFSLAQAADEYGAFINDGAILATNRTGYLQVSAVGGLGNFKLTAIDIGEYDINSSVSASEFTNVYVEGFLGGVSQGVSNIVSGSNNYVTTYPINLGSLTSKVIDTYKVYFTAKPGSNLTALNLTSFSIASAVAATAPAVTTVNSSSITSTTGTLAGNVTADGGATVTEKGVVYSTSANPTTVAGTKIVNATAGTGTISVNATGLTANTTYHFRAYATNSAGTSYGEDLTFTTQAASSPTSLNAGDMAMTAWSAINNTVDVVTLKDLSAGTIVNFTDWGWSNPDGAWAASSVSSIGEGNIKWTLSSAVSKGSVIRITYTNGANITLKNLTTNTAIAAADLTFTGYGNVLTDLIVNTGDNFFIYQGLSTNPNFIFGFNNTISTTSSSPTIDATGWVPTGSFTTGYAIASNLPDGNGSQNALTNGVNAIGFTSRQTNVAYTGPTTATDAATWLSRIANVNNWTQQGSTVTPSYESANKIIIGSVAATAPIVSTTATSTYAATTATLAGNVSSDGGATVTEKGVVYNTSSNPTTANSKLVNSAAGTGGISVDATGLTPGTTYYFKAYAINSAGTAYGTEQTFTTTASATPTVTTAGTIEAFAGCYGSSTTGQSFTVSGNNLTGDLVITPPLGFQLSNNNIGFSGVGITLTPVSSTVAATTLYVRMAAATSSPAAGNITVSSAGATTKNIPVSGTVNALPTITTSAITSVSNTATSFSIPYSATTGSPDSYTISTGTRSLTGFAAVNNSVLGTSPINVVIPASSAGTYDFNLRVTNSATGCVSAIVPLTLTITAPAVTAAPVVIVPANGSMVSTTTPTYGGTAPAGSTITIYSDGVSLANTTTANSAGNWAITQPTALTQGAHTVYATAQLSGNSVSANSNTNTFTVDNIRPTVAISSTAGASGGSTGTSPIPFTVTFSEAVTGFVVADLTAVNATITGFAGSGTTYTFNATPAASGAVTISLPANVAQDAAGNGNTAATQFSITYSQAVTAAPVVIVPANGSMVSTTTPTYGGTAPAGSTITIYSDGVSLANTITANSAGNWAITQPAALTQGAHTVYATAQLSGNSVSANSNTNTFTVDNIRPTVAISSTAGASGGSTGTSPIPFTVTFSEAVTGFVVADLTAVNATITGFAGSGTTYTFNATPAASGAVTISLPANVAQDAAGNGNTAATQFSITYSQAVTAAPVVIVPANGSMVSTTTPTYGGTAPAGSTITIYSDGVSLANTITANSAGNWAITQPAALTQGSHTVYATAQLSGNSVSANSNTNTFTVDNIKPTVAISSNKSALKAGETATITFTFSEDPGATFTWNGSSGDVVLSGGTLSAISGSGAIRNANFTPDANTNAGTASITVAAGSYADAAGNLGSAGATPSLVFDTQLPPAPVVVTVANGSLTITDKPIYTGTAEAGSTVTVYVDGGSIGTATASTSGTWSKSQPVALLTGSHTVYALATDAAGNNSANSNTNTFTIDATAPVIASVSVPANGTYVAGENLDFAVEFTESTTVDQLGGTPYLSVTLNTGGVVMAKYVSGSGLSTHTYRYTVKATDKDLDGIALGSLTLNGGTVKDAAGNNAVLTLNNIASTAGVLVDGTPIVAQTITFNALAAKTYGDADFDLNATASSGLPVSFTSSNAAVASINGKTVTVHKAGVVTITATQAGNSGYSAAQSVSQTLTINAKAIAVTASAQSKVYGTADPALTYTITSGSLVGTDVLNGTLTREPGENAGTYIIKQGTLALNANYALTFQTANLAINKATLTATANNQSKVYGQAIPPLTVSYSGFVNGETKTSLTTEAIAVTIATLTSPVGTYTITPSGGSAANYDLAYVNGTLTVTADQPVITFASLPAKTYGDADFAPGAGSTNNTTAISYNSDNAAVATIINGKIHIVGSGLAHITASQAADVNYIAAQSVVQDLVVNKAAITITAAAKSKTYGDADPALTYQVTSGTLKGNDTFSGTLTREPGENAGAYAIKQGTLALTSNYAITFTGADLSISTRAITVAATAKTKTYGEADPAFAYTITTGTLAGNDALTGTLTRNAGETAGSYAIKQGSLSAGDNYALTYTPANLTITQRAVNIAAVSKSKIYGEADPELTYSINGGSLVTGDTFSGSLTREAGEAAGTYAIRQGTVALNNNYVLTYTGANLTIGQALQNITFAGLPAKTYGDADFTAGATSSNTIIPVTYSSDNAAVASIVNGRIHIVGAGTANITASQAGNANYVASQNVTRELTVAKADIAVTAAAKSKTYGEADPALTYSITGGSLKGSDVFTGSLTRNAGENTGTYAIKQGTLALNNNYNLSYEGADLSIGKKAVTVAAAIKSKIYGQADPALTYNITAGTLVGNDSFTGILSRDAGENIGTYAIKQGTLALNSNYTLTYNGAALEIGKKAIAVTANAQSKTYGEADPALTYTFSPALVTGDTFSGSLTRDAGENAGTYAIKQGGLVLSSNYALTYTGGNLTIGKKDLVIKADDQNKRYGEVNPALTVSYNGFANGDDAGKLTAQPVARTTANQASAAGSYDITVTGAASDNYNITYLKGTLTISKAQLTVAAVNQSKTYGEANPQLTVTYSGFLNGDTKANLSAQPVANTAATAQSGAGNYDISVSGAASNSYDIVYTKGTLTINKAPLTITADNKTRTYGASNPAFTVSYSGFVNSDTQASLSAQPVLGTAANATSGVGAYDITASGAASNNYSIVYNKGVLTIAPANRSIAFNRPLQATYGDADFAAGATLSSGETVVYSSDNNSVATIINGRIHIVGAGTANITASAPVNGNYTSTQPVTQLLTVNKARQTIDFTSIPVLNRVTGKYDLSVVRASSGLPVSFTVADPFIVTLDGNTLKANRIGSTQVTASQAGNANYLAANSVVQTIEVNDADGGNEIVVRQAVSPNGDGVNDFLYIEGIQEHPDNSVTVINRNGVKVFEIKGYDNRSRVFDGRSSVTNQMQQAGTYFFLLQYEGKRKTGWFVLKY